VIGRLAVEHAVADHRPERREVVGIRRAAHLLVGRHMEVRATEPPVAQQRVDVVVPRDQPLVGRLEPAHRRGVAQVGVRVIGVRDELR
jgi:hypothetical protein